MFKLPRSKQVDSIKLKLIKTKSRQIVDFMSWQEYMDDDRTFYSVNENAISGERHV